MSAPNTLQNTAPAAPQGGRFTRWVLSLPAATRVLLFINIAVYLYNVVFHWGDWNFMEYQYCLTWNGWDELYRIMTSAYLHAGILHLLMNMMSVYYLGLQLEPKFGTLPLLGMAVAFNVLQDILYLGIQNLLSFTPEWFQGSCAVGFSGVIFSFVMIEVSLTPGDRRSVFGFCVVPAWIYPWVMLLVLSLMIPQASFLGHLSGILIGWMYTKGLLSIFTIKRSWIIAFESLSFYNSFVATSEIYHKCPAEPVFRTHDSLAALAEAMGCNRLLSMCECSPACSRRCDAMWMRISSWWAGTRRNVAERRADHQSMRMAQQNRYEMVAEEDMDVEDGLYELPTPPSTSPPSLGLSSLATTTTAQPSSCCSSSNDGQQTEGSCCGPAPQRNANGLSHAPAQATGSCCSPSNAVSSGSTNGSLPANALGSASSSPTNTVSSSSSNHARQPPPDARKKHHTSRLLK